MIQGEDGMMKRILATALALGFLFALGAAQAACSSCSYDATGFCKVCGQEQPAQSVSSVFQIANAGNLLWFMKNVNGGYTNTRDAVLRADIVFNPGTFDARGNYSPQTNEEPRAFVGIGNQNNPYKATFDGNGHTISGLYLNRETDSFAGLFGILDASATVKNVHVRNSYFRSYSESGGIVSRNYGNVTGCSFDGFAEVVDGRYFAGGIVSKNYGTIEKCWNLGSVKGPEMVGGITGQNESGAVVKNCYNAGAVTGPKTTGGIVGVNAEGATVASCHNVGNVGTTGGSVGAVVGKLSSGSTIKNSYYQETSSMQHAVGYEVSGSTRESTDGYSEAVFRSGKIAYKLNGSTSTGDLAWYQTIGTDPYPVFEGEKVYFQAGGSPAYTNSLQYPLTVTNGSGSGSYAAGASVAITANMPETGMQFDKWTGTDGLTFTAGSANDAEAVFAMPANALSIAATYKQMEHTIFYFLDSEDAQSNKQMGYGYNATAVVLGEEALGESKADHIFAGWAAEKNGEVVYRSGDPLTITSDVNLYGVWKRVYNIECAAAENGRVEASRSSAAAGDSIILMLYPDEGYVLDTITAVNLADQMSVVLTAVDGGYTFIMPAGGVKVAANFVAGAGNIPPVGGGGKDVPKTGDSTNLTLWLTLMCASLGGIWFLGRRRVRA